MGLGDPVYDAVFRYFHILAGITWIGLLYFFNLVNLPLLKFKMSNPVDVEMGEKASAHITLKTLWWFRWGAMFTLIFGLILIEVKRMQFGSMGGYFFENGPAGYLILLGVILAITMWFNVWFLIWPNQKVILSNNLKIAAGVSEEEKAKLTADNGPRVKTAVMASRYNTWASIPMLFGMVFGAHGGGIGEDWGDFIGPLGILAVVLVAMVYMSYRKA